VDLEQQIQSLLEKGDLQRAASRAVEGYGPEVFGFLVSLVGDTRDASEVFSQTCEDLWVGLERFEGRCSMRTWLYTLARHAAARYRRSAHRRPGRRMALSQVSEIADRVRTQTLPFLRTEAKSELARIRDALDEEDRALLVLRVDRGLSWTDIALVFAGDGASKATMERTSARLRKRFQAVKTEIRKRAREAGLFPNSEPPKSKRRAGPVSARVPPGQGS
jgi:RNA polymerase sigma-70 factor (ECF subfamily)